jgi:hypothetical protein
VSGQSATYTEDLWVQTKGTSGTTSTGTATGTSNSTNGNEEYLLVKMTVTAQTSPGQLNSTATFTNWNGGQTVTPPPASEVTH